VMPAPAVVPSGPPADAAGSAHAPSPTSGATPGAIRVSPMRGGGTTHQPTAAPGPPAAPGATSAPGPSAGPPRPSEPLSSAPSPSDLATLAPEREEPPLPDEARDVAARASAAPTTPLEASDTGILSVRFTRGAETSRIVLAMEELRAVFRDRPGATRVIFHIPSTAGGTLPMEVRGGVAYDVELLAEVQRRLGEGLVRLELSGPRAG